MSIAIQNNTTTYTTANTKTTTTEKAATTASTTEDAAAVYTKSSDTTTSSTNQIYDRTSIASKLKADQESRIASMQSLVEKTIAKQSSAYSLANLFRDYASTASAEEIAAAKESISEDGYWGVEQTSDRIVSLAVALSGGDTDKADELIAAIQKGFEKATSAWGEDLPQLCQDTMDATLKKMDDWKNGITSAEDYANVIY